MKIVFVIDSWNKGNGCILVTHTLESAGRYRIDKTMDGKEELYQDVIKSHFQAKGLLPKGEKISPLLIKKDHGG